MSDLKTYISGLWEGGRGKNDFRIIETHGTRYIKPYKTVSPEFIHFGNSLFYRARKGDAIKKIAERIISYTSYNKIYRLKSAIMHSNGLREDTIKNDMSLFIPDSIPAILPDINNKKKPELIYIRGLYFTGISAGSDNFTNIISAFPKIGINAVVIDAKDVNGEVTYLSRTPIAVKYNTSEKYSIDNIDRLIRILKQHNIYTIARIAVFRDHLLCKKSPDLAIRSRRTGGVWNAGSKEIWCDPTNKYVQDYNIGLALELADKGVDEIQFDYIRFPTTGDLSDAAYAYNFGKMSRENTISLFLKRAYTEITARNSLLSIDIFGVVAWEKEIDIEKTGQRISSLSKYCDVISPMLYPSHFDDNFDGYASPGDEPYYFIHEGCKRTAHLSAGRPIRPWLQAFSWRITPARYNEDYMLKQISASRECGANGFLFWHSANSYDLVYRALSRIAPKKEDPAKTN